jgi:hypothetical protein
MDIFSPVIMPDYSAGRPDTKCVDNEKPVFSGRLTGSDPASCQNGFITHHNNVNIYRIIAINPAIGE